MRNSNKKPKLARNKKSVSKVKIKKNETNLIRELEKLKDNIKNPENLKLATKIIGAILKGWTHYEVCRLIAQLIDKF